MAGLIFSDLTFNGPLPSMTWFEKSAIKNFRKHLLQFQGAPNLKYLQIGVWKGDASVWLLENVLTHSTSVLFDLDTWEGSQEHFAENMAEVEKEYDEKMKNYKNVVKIKADSKEYLPRCSEVFDFIYIDGAHDVFSILADAENSWKLLKPEGILCFDDYDWTDETELSIDAFLGKHVGKYNSLVTNHQAWIQKC